MERYLEIDKYTDRYMDRYIDRWIDIYTNVDGISTMES